MSELAQAVPIVDRKVTCPCGCNNTFQVKQVKGFGAAYMDSREEANFSHLEILKFLLQLVPGTEWTNRQLYMWMETWYGNQRKILPFEFPRVQGGVSELKRKNLIVSVNQKFYKLTGNVEYAKRVVDTGRF